MSRLTDHGVIVVMVLLTINVFVLNLLVLSRARTPEIEAAATVQQEGEIVKPQCDSACQEAIIARLITATPLPQEEPSRSDRPSEEAVRREWYIPLGSGTTQSNDWAELPGAEATIDTSNYPNIKHVIFETYLSIPTANGVVSAKLYNVTKQHDVWFSEVSAETDKVSGRQVTVTLEPGKNLYRVTMKSSMGYQAVMTNARIIIVTE